RRPSPRLHRQPPRRLERLTPPREHHRLTSLPGLVLRPLPRLRPRVQRQVEGSSPCPLRLTRRNGASHQRLTERARRPRTSRCPGRNSGGVSTSGSPPRRPRQAGPGDPSHVGCPAPAQQQEKREHTRKFS